MLEIAVSNAWKHTHPAAMIGLLELAQVENARGSSALESYKREVEEQLRTAHRGFSRSAFRAHPVLSAYHQYYKRFKKTYHVLLQIESIALRQKRLPTISPLVDANFIAEMQTFVLTAGHDVARLREPVSIDISREGDSITQMSGETRAMRQGDMVMRDAKGICCSIIYGQDNRSPISPATDHVLYVSYGPPGVPPEALSRQLQQVEEHVRLVSPSAIQLQSRLIAAA
jgi:DNA/RNA-binding domain of Phe-tRNA-synthetase-like protein